MAELVKELLELAQHKVCKFKDLESHSNSSSAEFTSHQRTYGRVLPAGSCLSIGSFD